MNTHVELMELYTRQCTRNQASCWPSNRYQSTQIFKTSLKRSVSCSSVTGWYCIKIYIHNVMYMCWHGKFSRDTPTTLHVHHIRTCSQYVVKYYGSYFKNTDLWIVMEYCGAGSVSDIMRIINRPVSCHRFVTLRLSRFTLWLGVHLLDSSKRRR